MAYKYSMVFDTGNADQHYAHSSRNHDLAGFMLPKGDIYSGLHCLSVYIKYWEYKEIGLGLVSVLKLYDHLFNAAVRARILIHGGDRHHCWSRRFQMLKGFSSDYLDDGSHVQGDEMQPLPVDSA